MLTLEIQILPFIPGSFKLQACCFEIGVGDGEFMKERINLTMSSVLRSTLVEVGESHKVCAKAVVKIKGTLGSNARNMEEGLDVSIGII